MMGSIAYDLTMAIPWRMLVQLRGPNCINDGLNFSITPLLKNASSSRIVFRLLPRLVRFPFLLYSLIVLDIIEWPNLKATVANSLTTVGLTFGLYCDVSVRARLYFSIISGPRMTGSQSRNVINCNSAPSNLRDSSNK